MDTIIRGTTPTFRFTFNTIDVNTIVGGYFTAFQSNDVVIEKEFTAENIQEDGVEFSLTQADTLSLEKTKKVAITFDWLTSGGVRGRSNKSYYNVENSGHEGVI